MDIKKVIDLVIKHNIMIETDDGLDVVEYDTTKFKDEDEFFKYKLKSFNGEEKIIMIKFMKEKSYNFRDYI